MANAEASGTKGGMARLRAIVGGSAGNTVEVYDWFAYASFALYFAKAFFPEGDQTGQLLKTAAVFAVGFLARPLGAWLMGIYADRVGRRAALMLSVSLMCLGSLIIGLCPSAAQIGVAAPTILVLARILQGVSLGGEYGTSAVYLSEMAGRERRGFWSSFQYVTLISGQILAMATLVILQSVMSAHQLDAWGWRIPFFIGAGLAVVVVWMRRRLDETPSFLVRGKERARVMMLFTRHPRESLIVFGLTAGGTLAYYTYTTYVQQFLVNTSGFTKTTATQITFAALVLFMVIQPLFGWLSDKVGRRAVLMIFGVCGVLGTWPLMSFLAHTQDARMAFVFVALSMVVLAAYTSVNAVVKSELFPTEVRALGVALPYAFANSLFGGTAVYAALWFKRMGHETWFYTYVTVVIGLSLLVYVLMRDTKQHSQILED